MNIDSLSITPNSFQNTCINVAQTPSNQIVANIHKVKNAPFDKFNLKGLPPEIVMDYIVKYLKPSDVKNLNKSKAYQHIPIYHNYLRAPNYRHVVNEWLTWQKTPPIAEGENRKLAVERMIECLENNGERLDLSYLHLTSLPNLKPLKSLLVLDFIGNDVRPIYHEFFEKINEGLLYCAFSTWKEFRPFRCLPESIEKIHIDSDSQVFSAGYYDCAIKTKACNNLFRSIEKTFNTTNYEDDFEQDYLNIYHL